MEEEKSVFYIIQEIDKNILKQQERMMDNFADNWRYTEAKTNIKEFLKQRKQILKMNKKYGFSFNG